jgi:hypothetical protein
MIIEVNAEIDDIRCRRGTYVRPEDGIIVNSVDSSLMTGYCDGFDYFTQHQLMPAADGRKVVAIMAGDVRGSLHILFVSVAFDWPGQECQREVECRDGFCG